jgi:ubiquinone/menaquinone biosynthesis C-methylase UbiE
MTQMRYSDKLVQRINELYHDYAGKDYSQSHPEIFEEEVFRWKYLSSRYLSTLAHPIRILDIGSGTGFVAGIICQALKEEDTIILSDISQEMVDLAKRKFEGERYGPHLKFVKIAVHTPYRISFESHSIDVITINSVLHHVQDVQTFLNEVDRLLRPGGLLLICHEPNQKFFDNSLPYWAYTFASFLDLAPANLSRATRIAALELSRRIGVERFARRVYYLMGSAREKRVSGIAQSSAQALMLADINRKLIAEHLISTPLVLDVAKLVDIRATSGFNPSELVPSYEILRLDTYDHLYKFKTLHRRNAFVKLFDSALSKMLPNEGANFCVVLKKPAI